MNKILVVDDELQVGKQLQLVLNSCGYEVLLAFNGYEAIIAIGQQSLDLVLLGISLDSEPNGLEVCRIVREWSRVPIIMLSEPVEEKTKVQAFELGADDYVTKPFGMEELRARIQAVLRRCSFGPNPAIQTEIRVGDLLIDLRNRQVFVEGEEVHLTPKEYELLKLLANQPGKVVPYHTILKKLWGENYTSEDHNVRVFVNYLRKKLRENPVRNVRYILNESGVGYGFVSLE
jgi:two-component system, OmpR family, KDP operon response regulator KdpE